MSRRNKPKQTNAKGQTNQAAASPANRPSDKAPVWDGWLRVVERYPYRTLLLLFVGIGVVVFQDYFFLKYVYYFKDIGSDEINGTLPTVKMMVRQIVDGTWPNFYTFYRGMGQSAFSGMPTEPFRLLTDGITRGMVHAYGEAYYTTGRAWVMFGLYFLSVALLGYAYLRTLELDKVVSLIGALGLSYSGYMVMGSGWGHNFLVLFGLLMLWSFEQYLRHGRWVLFALAISSLSSNAFYLYFFGLILVVYSTFRFADKGLAVGAMLRHYFVLLGLSVWGVLVNAVNVLPNYLTLFNSPRVSGTVATVGKGAVSAVYQIDNFPEWLTVLYRTLSTDFLGTGSLYKGWYNYLEAPAFYVGLFSLLLVPQLFALLPRGRRRWVWGVFVGFWLLSAMVPALRYLLHAYVGNYYKGPYDVALGLALLLPAMAGLQEAIRQQRIHLATLLVSAAALLVLANWPLSAPLKQAVRSDVRLWVSLFVVLHTAILYLLGRKDQHRLAVLLLLAAVVVELGLFSSLSIKKRRAYTYREFKSNVGGYNDNTVEAVRWMHGQDSSLFYRAEKDFSSGTSEHGSLNDAMAQGYYGTASYSSFNQEHYIKFLQATEVIPLDDETQTRWAPGVRNRPLLQSLVSVKYYFSRQAQSDMLRFGYEAVHQAGDVYVLRNRYALPFGFCYQQGMARSEFDRLSTLQKDLCLLQNLVVPDELLPSTTLAARTHADTLMRFGFAQYDSLVALRRTHAFELTRFAEDQIEGRIRVDSKQYLFFSIPYEVGWIATVDGQAQLPINAQIGFLALALEPGQHEVVLRYRPPYYVATIWVSYGSLLALLLAYAGHVWYRRRAA